jgi:transposase
MSHALDKTTVKRILQLHQLQGLSPQIIGQRFGLGTARIYNIIRRQAPSSKLQAPSSKRLKKDIIKI